MANLSETLFAEIWFEQNQIIFHDKKMSWLDRFEIANQNAAAWRAFCKDFKAFSIKSSALIGVFIFQIIRNHHLHASGLFAVFVESLLILVS